MKTIQENILLAPYTNYRIGGPARFFAQPSSLKDVAAVLAFSKKYKLARFILASGTNVLIPDNGFAGVVIRPAIAGISRVGNRVRAGAGVSLHDLLEFTAHHGLSGLEWAGGIPGTVGGAVRGNAGAYGSETKDVIVGVKSISATGTPQVRNNKQCRFGYRSSVFKEKNGAELVIEATFALKPADPMAVRAAIDEKIAYRQLRHPLEHPNVGSVFKNVPLVDVSMSRLKKNLPSGVDIPVKNDPFPVIPAAFLIAHAGLAGLSCGGAMLSPKHTAFIVNMLGATAQDVVSLMNVIQKEVKRQFGVVLEPEVQIV